jgi:hypothetical protein
MPSWPSDAACAVSSASCQFGPRRGSSPPLSPASAGDRELHLLGVLNDPGGAQDFEADNATVFAEVGDHARANLVALSDRRSPQRID